MPTVEDPEPRSDDPFEGLVLDDEFVRAAAVKEQSGRARMLAARWRHTPPQAESWRASADVPRIRRGLFGRRAKRVDRPAARAGRSGWWSGLGVALSVCVVLGLIALAGAADRQPGPAALPPVGPETASPTAAPPSVAPDTPTVEHPWAGSPAEAWPAGADGITVPDATAVGVYSRKEVAAQLAAVRSFLVLTAVDPKTLAGDTPQAALDLLDRQEKARLGKAVAHPTEADDPTVWLSRFDPRLAVPVTDVVKVQGRTTFEGDGKHGLVVHTDYTYVYALRPGPDVGKEPASPAPGSTARPVLWQDGTDSPVVEREIVRRELDFTFYDPAHYIVQRGKPVLTHMQADFGNNVCDTSGGYLVTSFPQTRESVGPTGGATIDPYDRSKPMEQGGGCGTLSRS
ncbi:hypothetical protein [Kitasatospora paranensis]|uniref:YkuD domain-containing protein n=1 Tax=Kitasatospora paranensis TaxID=258053 RepID=A0ABW2FYZ9_9ACTN